MVEFHPAYFDLVILAISTNLHDFAWHNESRGGHLAQTALIYMFCQPEGVVMCPMAMTYSHSLNTTPPNESEWILLIMSTEYDRREILQRKKPVTSSVYLCQKAWGFRNPIQFQES